MQAVLVMFRSDGERRSFSVTRDMTVIGRREDCDLRIPLGDVSRKHARLVRDGDTLRLEDLGSSNGTYLNGQRVQEAILTPGDSVQIGPVVFVLQVNGYPGDGDLIPVTADLVDQNGAMSAPPDMDALEPVAHADMMEDVTELEPLDDAGHMDLEPLADAGMDLEPLPNLDDDMGLVEPAPKIVPPRKEKAAAAKGKPMAAPTPSPREMEPIPLDDSLALHEPLALDEPLEIDEPLALHEPLALDDPLALDEPIPHDAQMAEESLPPLPVLEAGAGDELDLLSMEESSLESGHESSHIASAESKGEHDSEPLPLMEAEPHDELLPLAPSKMELAHDAEPNHLGQPAEEDDLDGMLLLDDDEPAHELSSPAIPGANVKAPTDVPVAASDDDLDAMLFGDEGPEHDLQSLSLEDIEGDQDLLPRGLAASNSASAPPPLPPHLPMSAGVPAAHAFEEKPATLDGESVAEEELPSFADFANLDAIPLLGEDADLDALPMHLMGEDADIETMPAHVPMPAVKPAENRRHDEQSDVDLLADLGTEGELDVLPDEPGQGLSVDSMHLDMDLDSEHRPHA